MNRIFELGKVFRNEGLSSRHSPEFTMLEAYAAYEDMWYFSSLLQELLIETVDRFSSFIDPRISGLIRSQWDIVKLTDLVERTFQMKLDKYQSWSLSDLKGEFTRKSGRTIPEYLTSNADVLFWVFDRIVTRRIKVPTIVYGFPSKVSPLAKSDPRNSDLALRFEFYFEGVEVANCFTELNDPFEQKRRFDQQLKARKHSSAEFEIEETNQLNKEFVEALFFGMPPTAGIGIGIDRLIMLLLGKKSIREVILFPLLKDDE